MQLDPDGTGGSTAGAGSSDAKPFVICLSSLELF